MVRSLRGRLLLWYAFVLVAAVGGFGAILYTWTRAARFEQVDVRLTSAAEYFDAVLRSFPPRMLDQNAELPRQRPRPNPPEGKERPAPRGKDGRPPPEPFDPEGPPPPPGFFDPENPPPPPRDPQRDPPRDPQRPQRTPEDALASLTLPPGWVLPPEPKDRPYYAVWLNDGKMLKSENWSGHERNPPPFGQLGNRVQLTTMDGFREATIQGPRQTRILIGQPVQREISESRNFALRIVAVGLGIVLIGLAGGWLVASRVVRPIAAMSETATAISAADMSRRIDTKKIDTELAGLAESLNGAFDRLSAAFARQSQFTADASHELRTPLAIMRTNAELSLSKDRPVEDYRATITTCLQAAKRMSGIVDGLLTLARSDGGVEVKKKPLRLDAVVGEAVDAMKSIANAAQITITTDLQPIQIVGDPDGLSRMITNLVSNAIKYNRAGGTVAVTVRPADGGAEIVVKDTGIGIPDGDQTHIFERFYRVDKARARATGGAGLGLAICQTVVENHGGTIAVESVHDRGTTFTVRIPKQNP